MSFHRHSPSIVFRSTPQTPSTTHPVTTFNHIMFCALLGDNPVKSATNTLPSVLCFTSNVNTIRVRWCSGEMDKINIHKDAFSEAVTQNAVRPANAASHFPPLNVSKDCLSGGTIMLHRSINQCRSCPQPPNDESEQLRDGSLSADLPRHQQRHSAASWRSQRCRAHIVAKIMEMMSKQLQETDPAETLV